jgi:alpha-galactosidase
MLRRPRTNPGAWLVLGAVVGALALLGTAPGAAARLARTPPMGWNSWYTAHCGVTEQDVLRNARALVDTGMAERGYRYANVDGCWEAGGRDPQGRLQADPIRFPSGMAALGRAIHAMGLRYGIYTSAGPTICNHAQPGSMGHYLRDMRTFASWGVDYVKVDWCNVPAGTDPRTVYARVARAAAKAGRPMIVTVSTPGVRKPWKWAHSYGQTWRISADANGTWRGVTAALDVDAPLWRYAGPGRWNDPDVLQVGDHVLTEAEERAHFSLWSMLAAPLLAGYDIPSMAPASLDVLRNRDVIAVDQDRLGRQARRVRRSHGVETWVRKLSGGAWAVAVLNRSGRPRHVALTPSRWLPARARYVSRELWSGAARTVGEKEALRETVPSHGVAMWRIRPTD